MQVVATIETGDGRIAVLRGMTALTLELTTSEGSLDTTLYPLEAKILAEALKESIKGLRKG
jgi:hypothetical protein